MSEFHIVAFSGNLRRPSSTLCLTHEIAEMVRRKSQADVSVFDLLDLDQTVCTFDRAELSMQSSELVRRIETADALIVATPVYKGAYCGLMKHVIDLLSPEALYGKPVLLAANGGGARHALVVEHQLRPLFGFFEADTIPTGVYACADDFQDGRLTDAGVLDRVEKATDQMVSRIGVNPQPRLSLVNSL